MTADRALLWLMRFNAAVVLLAAPCMLLPFEWMNAVHRDWLGLGQLPDAKITRYMARSLALLYTCSGLGTLFVTLYWERYRSAVPFFAWVHVVFGVSMILIDLDADLPWWWIAGEGPPLVAMGILMIWLCRRASLGNPGDLVQ